MQSRPQKSVGATSAKKKCRCIVEKKNSLNNYLSLFPPHDSFYTPHVKFSIKSPFRFAETMTHKYLQKPWFLETELFCYTNFMVSINRGLLKFRFVKTMVIVAKCVPFLGSKLDLRGQNCNPPE
jgi:hypothetical protein